MTKYYDEKAKERTNRYRAANRDKLTLDLPKGTKAIWQEQAAKAGEKSLTQYIKRLIEEDAKKL